MILSDLSDGMLDEAKIKLGKYNNIQFKKIDIMDIPYEDETFDFVIANMMLYHIPDLQKGLLEVKRVLKQKGVFYCATFGENGINQYISSVLKPGKIKDEYSFTLQNGKSKLEKFFANTKRIKYEDSLEVTNTKDLVDYIYTTISFNSIESDLSRDEVESIFEEKKQSRAIRIPKEYGMFISYK